MGDQVKKEARQPSPHTPQPPASESRRAGAEAAEDHLGPSTEGDTAPETTVATAGDTEHSQYHSHIPPGFSLVVNDVDAERDDSQSTPDEKTMESGFGVEVVVALECESEDNTYNKDFATERDSYRQGTLTHSSSQKELSDARIKQIQGEVESRKNEFARLLEEHAQVVKQLKAMEEEEGGDRVGVGRQQLH